jgi:hypothetical protein
MAKAKKQRRPRGDTWSIRVSRTTHKRVVAWARREHFKNRAAYDVLVNRKLDELETAKSQAIPAVASTPGRIDASKITPATAATQEA